MNRPAPPLLAPALVSLVALAVAGCEGGETLRRINTDGEANRIARTVDDCNEYSGDAQRLAKLFAAGKLPQGDAFKRYAKYNYFATHEARVAGDSATLVVTLNDAKTSQDVGTKEWTFKKEGDAWKIDSAPLP